MLEELRGGGSEHDVINIEEQVYSVSATTIDEE
jgi:hypothetical protein